ncbi:MAG: hypothetical protein R3F48_15500 [Candidatus Zixiibacteriota bacterium]
MPFCPKCRYEYEYGIGMCPDCDERLVESLPEESDESNGDDLAEQYNDWMLLAAVNSQYAAAMCHEGLLAKNIPAIVHSETGHFGITGQMGMSTYPPIGGNYKIYVPKQFLEDAVQEAQILLGEDWESARAI